MTGNFSPKYVKAKVKFIYENSTYECGEHLINVKGVMPFKWDRFEPMEAVGKPCRVSISLIGEIAFEISCDALLTCEETAGRTDLGMAFMIIPQDAAKLQAIIGEHGTLPEFARKFPRILFLETVSVMPSRVILRQRLGDEVTDVVGDIVDVSPNGIQVTTEDMRCALAIPGEIWDVILQPRGAFAIPVAFVGEIKRIVHLVDPISGNARRNFSMSISQITNTQKNLFTDLLRQVVTRIRG